jgi:aspartyl-tRNA(Asn)/glutamyl-tRNA(Gln) amidotransferase subunit A
MEVNDLVTMPAHRLAREISAGVVSPVDVVDAYLERIRRYDGRLGAFVEVYESEARLAAEAAHRAIRAGHAVGPLHGMPIALKDLVEIEGKVVTGGSAVWRERRSKRTATLARRLIAQGFIIVGKTHLVEFAMGGWGTNRRLGTPWNPWDREVARTPGGSSSGSGVAVAAGLAPWAVGTDTGGSVRLPASWCGLTGLKTSVGRVSIDGILPLSKTLDTPGPMARSVEDTALLYTAMLGHDPSDPRSLVFPASDPLTELRRGVRGLRFASMPESERAVVTPEVLAAYDRSLEVLAQLGAEIMSVPLPYGFADVAALNGRIIAAEGYALLKDILEDPTLPLDEDVCPRLLPGRDISSSAYLGALEERQQLKQQFATALAGVDGLLTPTTATTALPLSAVDQTKTPAHFTRFANLLDLCALALPNGFDSQGLPTSLQIVCPHGEEAKALRAGWAYQSATDWHERRPPEPDDAAAGAREGERA